MGRKLENLNGQKFGSLFVLKYDSNYKWFCKCLCGKIISVKSAKLKNGDTKTCGCKIGFSSGNSKLVEYKIWLGIKNRCYNKNYMHFDSYGKRGIKVCDRWLESFENFLEDMGKRPSKEFSIDRIDVNKDYSPENCRWVDQKTQARNKRNTKIVNYKGVEKPVIELCEELNLNYSKIISRLKRGWLVEKAFET